MAAFEEELRRLLSRAEALDAKLDAALSLFMLATAESLASEDLTPGDPEWKAIAARGEAVGLALLAKTAGWQVSALKEAEYATARPGGEAVAEEHRRMAASAAALGARAQEFAAYMREVGAMDVSDSDSESEG